MASWLGLRNYSCAFLSNSRWQPNWAEIVHQCSHGKLQETAFPGPWHQGGKGTKEQEKYNVMLEVRKEKRKKEGKKKKRKG